MKTISEALKEHIQGQTTTLATLWRIIRKDGVIQGFTNHSENIVYDGIEYEASTGYTPSQIEDSVGLQSDNLSVDIVFKSDGILEADLQGGIYDGATISILLVNYDDLSMGAMTLKTGRFGEVNFKDGRGTVELRSLSELMNNNHIGRVYAPICDADFCDSRCKLSKVNYSSSATATSVVEDVIFTVNSSHTTNDLQYGLVEWTSGDNVGYSMEIKENSAYTIVLVQPMPYPVKIGDQCKLVRGCDKLFATCKDKFNNVVNFRGFPHIPGQDSLLSYGSR